MNKRALLYSTLAAIFIVGIVGGAGVSRYINHKNEVSQLNHSLYMLANELSKAKNFDMKYSTLNPTGNLQKGYEVNLKVDVGQMYTLWTSVSPELVNEGFSKADVQEIDNGLLIVYTNIIPPYGTSSGSLDTVKRARDWITMFADALVVQSPKQEDYVARLRSKITAIAAKYSSYKSDSNFQVSN